MPNETSKSSLLHKLIIALVVCIGVLPVFFFFSIEIGIAEATRDTVTDTIVDGPLDRFVDNVAFGAGEKLTFDINYGFINAGTATLAVERLVEFNNRPCYQIVSRAQSNSFFTPFYPVDDRIESIMDAFGLFSWRFEKNLREGNYRSDRQYEFNQREHYTVYKGDTIEVAPFVQDAISAMYYVRTQKLEVGKSIMVPNFIDGRKFDLEVRILEREQVKVAAGTFDCIVVEPISSNVGVFKHDEKLKVWLTDDRLKMPVLMKSKIVVGSITAELTDFELGEISEF